MSKYVFNNIKHTCGECGNVVEGSKLSLGEVIEHSRHNWNDFGVEKGLRALKSRGGTASIEAFEKVFQDGDIGELEKEIRDLSEAEYDLWYKELWTYLDETYHFKCLEC